MKLTWLLVFLAIGATQCVPVPDGAPPCDDEPSNVNQKDNRNQSANGPWSNQNASSHQKGEADNVNQCDSANQTVNGDNSKQNYGAVQDGTGTNVNQSAGSHQKGVGDGIDQTASDCQNASGDNTKQIASGTQDVTGNNDNQKHVIDQNADTCNDNGENISKIHSVDQQSIKKDDGWDHSGAHIDQNSGTDVYSKRINDKGSSSDELKTKGNNSATTYVDGDKSYANLTKDNGSTHITKNEQLDHGAKVSDEHVTSDDDKSSATSETTDKGTTKTAVDTTKTGESDKEEVDKPGYHSTSSHSSSSTSTSTFTSFNSGDDDGSQPSGWGTPNKAEQALNGVNTSKGQASVNNKQHTGDSQGTWDNQGSNVQSVDHDSDLDLSSTKKGSNAYGNQQTTAGQDTENKAGSSKQMGQNSQTVRSAPNDWHDQQPGGWSKPQPGGGWSKPQPGGGWSKPQPGGGWSKPQPRDGWSQPEQPSDDGGSSVSNSDEVSHQKNTGPGQSSEANQSSDTKQTGSGHEVSGNNQDATIDQYGGGKANIGQDNNVDQSSCGSGQQDSTNNQSAVIKRHNKHPTHKWQ